MPNSNLRVERALSHLEVAALRVSPTRHAVEKVIAELGALLQAIEAARASLRAELIDRTARDARGEQ
jgi:hypothetical protein